MTMKKKAIVAGHICLDITPVFPENSGVNHNARDTARAADIGQILKPGKLIQMGRVDVHTGGAVANTGLAMGILGADVTLRAKLGNDAFGTMISGLLEGYQVHQEMLVAEQESTSYSVIVAPPGIDRIFLHNPGANATFCSADVPDELLKGAALLHFGYPPLMEKMYENDGAQLEDLFCRAKDCGTATSLDMAAVDEKSPAGRVDWKSILCRVLPFVDFFVPSVEELCFMLDKPRFAQWQERAGNRDITEILDIETDIRPLADQCMAMGAKVLLIKCGAPGLYYRTANEKAMENVGAAMALNVKEWANLEGFEKSYVPEKLLSGTGAGDTAIAAFLTAALEGRTPQECIRLAAATGASCVTAYDALSGLRSFDELEKKISAGWPKRA